MTENEIGKIVVDCAVRLHKETGPGLLESVYEVLLSHLLREAGLSVERQVSIPIKCFGIHFDEGFRADIVVENKVILELKSIERVTKAHKYLVNT
jgi:GxxExxY protein